MEDSDAKQLNFYVTRPHTCSYLPDRTAVTLFADPKVRASTELYSQLIDMGFRRSGDAIYRPHCDGCQACISLRLSAASFIPNRAQQRAQRRNEDLAFTVVAADYSEEHYALYRRYLAHRHSGGGMDDSGPADYMKLLTCGDVTTELYEFRLANKLLAVAITDRLERGLSAVYTFFDPDYADRSLGVYAVLQQIATARHQGLQWMYLGYWIKDCQKMRYKSQYQPAQAYWQGTWIDFEQLLAEY